MEPIKDIPLSETDDLATLVLELNDRLEAVNNNFAVLGRESGSGPAQRTFEQRGQPANPYTYSNPYVSAFDFLDPLYAQLRMAALQVREVNIMPNAVGQNQLQIDSVIARHISVGSVTADKISVNALSAISGNIGTITSGNVTIDTSGFIRGGATAYNDGTGFWMGYDSGAYKFFIGNSAGNKLLWDGTTLALTGSITATTGSIGGFDIGSDYIRDTANSFGLASTDSVGDSVRLWAGSTFADRATAPFRVRESGSIWGNRIDCITLFAGSGTTTSSLITVNGTINLSGSLPSGVAVIPTLVATGNGNKFSGIEITPTINKSTFTGLLAYGLQIYLGSGVGTGTINSAYGLYIDEVGVGTNNWGVYVDDNVPNYFAGSIQADGGINSTPVGASTPSTGAFTTLSATGAVSAGASDFQLKIDKAGHEAWYLRNLGSDAMSVHLNGEGDIATFSAAGLVMPGTSTKMLLGVSSELGGAAERVHVRAATNGGTDYGIIIGGDTSVNNVTAVRFYSTSAAVVGSITFSGTATAYNTSSDARLKTNIRDFTDSGEIIDRVMPRLFDWRSGKVDSVGFIAQELYETYPAAVSAGDRGEHIATQWGVDFSKLVPVLTAEVKALRRRVAQLENTA